MKNNILLLIQTDNDSVVLDYRSAAADAGFNLNDSSILVQQTDKPNPNRTAVPSVIYFSEKEYNLIGKLKNEKVMSSLQKKYDVLLVVGDFSNKVQKILNKVRSDRRVTINSNNVFLTINLRAASTNPKHLVNFVVDTLSKIN